MLIIFLQTQLFDIKQTKSKILFIHNTYYKHVYFFLFRIHFNKFCHLKKKAVISLNCLRLTEKLTFTLIVTYNQNDFFCRNRR